MIAAHIHDALAQVRELKMRVLNAQQFTGYSGRVRALGGAIALLAAFLMSANWYPRTTIAHLSGWGLVFLCAVLSNYSALLYWFLFHPESERDIRRLVPTIDALPPLAMGGILTGALILNRQYDMLFGMWMCLYGLANMSCRRTLPKALWPLGIFYVVCGTVCLCAPGITLTNPWPMGIVLGAGELVGGFIFHRNRISHGTVTDLPHSQEGSYE
ncbi:MAG TPA: hypothetical protein ENI81_10165 [Phycisphaerales bacterium]|nr:hypothetical protein [Phycisphaerales bacterium]